MMETQECPMRIEGVNVTSTDTRDGVALTFTTDSGNVEELRRRVQRIAMMFSRRGRHPMRSSGRMIPADVKYEIVERGARVIMTPTDPTRLDALRKHVRAIADRMQKGDCLMMPQASKEMHEEEPAPQEYGHDPHH
jgi:hypothetical protein